MEAELRADSDPRNSKRSEQTKILDLINPAFERSHCAEASGKVAADGPISLESQGSGQAARVFADVEL